MSRNSESRRTRRTVCGRVTTPSRRLSLAVSAGFENPAISQSDAPCCSSAARRGCQSLRAALVSAAVVSGDLVSEAAVPVSGEDLLPPNGVSAILRAVVGKPW